MLFLSGCAGVPPDLGRSDVDAMVAGRGQDGSAVVSAEGTAELLTHLTSEPLTPESVVRIALINNPELAATYATLGFGAADVYQAGRIRNPVFSASVLNSSLAFEQDQLTFGLAASFTDLITLSARKRLSTGAFAALKQSIGDEVLRVAADAEMNYYRYVGAQQVAALRARTAKAAGVSATLAERYRDAGNISAREMAMESAAASEARLQALSAETAEFAARTSLANVLGLSVGEAWQAPAQLELPLTSEADLDTLLDLARKSRLDLAAALSYADVLADRLGVVNWTRWLGELDLGVEREREASGGYLTGPTASWEVPIFNQHEDALLRANADLQIAVFEVRRITMDVDNSVALAHMALLNARARVQEYRDVLIPQRVQAVEQAQKEVSFMLIGVFELINVKQAEYDAYQGYLESIRDYWLGRVALSLAVGNSLPRDVKEDRNPIDVEMLIRPAPSGMDHSGSGAMQDHSQIHGKDDTEAGQMNHAGHEMMEKESMQPDSSDHSDHMMKETENTKAPDSDHSGHTMQASDKPDRETDADNGGSR
jgi:cobalt-zinc-cadmium efflux system outer membrane protein